MAPEAPCADEHGAATAQGTDASETDASEDARSSKTKGSASGEADDERRKMRRIERFSPPTSAEIAWGRIAAGRALDWSAPVSAAGVSVPPTQGKRAAKRAEAETLNRGLAGDSERNDRRKMPHQEIGVGTCTEASVCLTDGTNQKARWGEPL